MPAPLHVILPFATASDGACQTALPALTLPHLSRLLTQLHAGPLCLGDDYTLTPPHERALAQTLGWPDTPDGTLPWAAWQAGIGGRACAWFSPCHWSVGMEQVRLLPPDELQLTEAESHALLQALQPFAQEDGLALYCETPGRWRAEGDTLAQLPSASLDRVAHRRVDAWLPSARQHPQAAPLLRLQNEAQMLFYTQPVNDERAARGLPGINGFWIHGSGVWDGQGPSYPSHVQQPDALRQPALRGDWAAWVQAWHALDAQQAPQWLAHLQQGGPLQLTLCGERHSQTWHSSPPQNTTPPSVWQSTWATLKKRLQGPTRPSDTLATL